VEEADFKGGREEIEVVWLKFKFINEYVGKTNELYISLPDKANGERNERNVYNIKYIVY